MYKRQSQGYLTPIYPQSGYGMVLEIKFNDYIELHGGMERSYNPMKRKWETSPMHCSMKYPKVMTVKTKRISGSRRSSSLNSFCRKMCIRDRPEDMTEIALAEDKPETAVQFEWDTEGRPESTSYSPVSYTHL